MVYETKMGLLASKDRSEPRTPTGEKNDSMLVTDEKSIDLDVTDTSNSPIGGNEMSDVVDDTPQSSCTEETFLANKQTVDENQHTEKPADVSLLSPCEVTVANTLASDINDSHEIVAVEVLPEKRKRRAVDRGSFIQFSQEKKARQPKSKKPKQVDAEAEFETAWICVECKEAECMMQPEATQLLVCDGLCRRLFHYPCAGLEKLPLESETFTCGDCRKQSHPCAICSNYGVDNEDVFKCSKDNCGLFFHESCLTMRNVDIEIVVGPKSDHKAADSGEANECWQRIFVCPAHSCWTCTQTDLKEQEAEKEESPSYMENNKGKRNKKGRGKRKAKVGVFECKNERFLTRCLECPISYHISCIPPSARFHELATLCHLHASVCKLPELDPESSLQTKIESAVDRKLDIFTQRDVRRASAARSKSKNLFFPNISGQRKTKREAEYLEKIPDISEEELCFCLPCDIKDEVYSQPPSYRHVNALQYDSIHKPPRVPISEGICHCVGKCGDDCINRMLYMECFGNDSSLNQSSNGTRKTNCNVGPACGNRKVGQKKAAKCKPKREQGRGWGLVPINKVAKGDLVQEYLGEVIDEKMKESRLKEWAEEHPNDPNFYIMALQPGWYIDARNVANLARFINHSCEPNCSLTQINVNGRMHCGIFAMRDIEPGEFLSYDYHFDTKHGDRFVCHCGSKICRGTMKGGTGLQDSLSCKKNKSEVFEQAKAAYELDKKFLIEFYQDREARMSQTGALVPGADGGGSNEELVANGPQLKHREKARSNRIFLWRNATIGGNFVERFAKLDTKK